MKKLLRTRWVLLGIFVLTVIALGGTGKDAFASIRKLPAFTLYTLQGEEMNLPISSWSILYFFSPDCFPCFNTLLHFQKEISGKEEVLFFPICSECDWRALKSLQESLPAGFKVYFLSPRDRAALGIWNTPMFFLLSPNGRVIQRWEKDITYGEVEKFLPSVTESRSARNTSKSPCSSETICE